MIRIRDAKPSDAEGIIHVHFAAVHETARSSYSPEILAAWSGQSGESRNQNMREIILNRQSVVLVAEDPEGIAGFGEVVPDEHELRAVYVHPRRARQGVGRRLLKKLERRAVLLNLPCLQLVASLNAVEFYRHAGYDVIAEGVHRLPSGHAMKCVKMKKSLGKRQAHRLTSARADGAESRKRPNKRRGSAWR